VGRWGGDEFIILVDDGAEIRSQLARLRAAIAKRYHVPGRTGYVNIPLDVSIGVAEYQGEDDVQSILERADSELCRRRVVQSSRRRHKGVLDKNALNSP
jgi:GGDEF domain-containing protein